MWAHVDYESDGAGWGGDGSISTMNVKRSLKCWTEAGSPTGGFQWFVLLQGLLWYAGAQDRFLCCHIQNLRFVLLIGLLKPLVRFLDVGHFPYLSVIACCQLPAEVTWLVTCIPPVCSHMTSVYIHLLLKIPESETAPRKQHHEDLGALQTGQEQGSAEVQIRVGFWNINCKQPVWFILKSGNNWTPQPTCQERTEQTEEH